MSEQSTERSEPKRQDAAQTREGDDSEHAFIQSSLFVVLVAITLISVMVVFTIISALDLATDTDALTGILGTGTTVIGTLVGSFLGLRVGQQGREDAQARAEARRHEMEQVLWSALAHLPPEQAEEILKRPAPNQYPPSSH
jgi:predicted membrane-bound spermidine synthase